MGEDGAFFNKDLILGEHIYRFGVEGVKGAAGGQLGCGIETYGKEKKMYVWEYVFVGMVLVELIMEWVGR